MHVFIDGCSYNLDYVIYTHWFKGKLRVILNLPVTEIDEATFLLSKEDGDRLLFAMLQSNKAKLALTNNAE